MRYLLLLLSLMLSLFAVSTVKADNASQPLQVLSRESYDPRTFTLSDEDWRWLGEKRVFKVAVWHPEIPPLNMFTGDGKYEGMTSDYLMLVASKLGMRIELAGYPSREAALHALSQRDVDMMVDVSGRTPPFTSEFQYSHSFISDHPVLVHPRTRMGDRFVYQPGMRLAIARWYVDDKWIYDNFPGVRIVHFDTDEQAMASVAFQKNDFYIGNLVTASYLLERNFPNFLEFQTIYPERDTGSRFVVTRGEDVLLRTVNSALSAIPSTQSQIIFQQWSEGADIWRLRKQIPLTEKEHKWIERHPTVNVSVNAFYAPFTITDNNGNFYGVTADILKLISQRTGIKFLPVPAKSLDAMRTQLEKGEALFIGALSHSEERDDDLIFTRPYFYSPFVLVVKEGVKVKPETQHGLRIALVKGNPLTARLKSQYPDLHLIETPNASVAMQSVVEGDADMAVHTLFGASYMIDSYFKGQLQIAENIDARDGEIGFAVARSQPELLSILNKSLENISPSDISDIIKKWQTRPDVRLNTWELYRKQFWLVVGVAAIIVMTSLIWVYYMRREIVARKKAQNGLHNQLKFNETLINTLPLPVYVTDMEGNLRLHNKSFSDFFPGTVNTLSEKALNQQEHPLHSLWLSVNRHTREGGEGVHPSAIHERIFDGVKHCSVLHYAVTFTDETGLPVGFICTWMDMTHQEELNSALLEARERAEQANRAKSTFLATMSHEIRTPVSAIIGLLELLVKTSQSEKDKTDTVRVAWESARSLMGLIGDILDMARIESGRLELTPEWVRTSDLLPPVIRVFEGLARQKSIRLRSSLPAVIPHEVFVDPLRFRQVLSNLVSNAIKFTERGSVEVDLHITHSGSDGQAELRVSVRDTGKGMSEEEQADIFDPWVQARAGKNQSGSGLGLAICAQLVKMMGGSITMKSQPDKGTTVAFSISVNINMEAREPEDEPVSDVAGEHKQLRILTVDDHPANRMLLRHQLGHLGHEVVEARDGEEGWRIWQSGEFDVVITDCSMPGMDGLALTRLIRQHQHEGVIILGLTANAWPEERTRCLDAGMDDCLFKPLQLPQLQAILDNVSEQVSQRGDSSLLLRDLLNFNDLFALTHNNNAMLKELLSVTLSSNQEDLRMAEDLFVLEDWPELAKCIHRISGAAQIIGAMRAERSSRLLEQACLSSEMDLAALAVQWQEAHEAVNELNGCIANWLDSTSEK